MVATRRSTKATSHTDLESAALSGVLKSATSVKAGQKHEQIDEVEIPEKKKAKSIIEEVPNKTLESQGGQEQPHTSADENSKPEETTNIFPTDVKTVPDGNPVTDAGKPADRNPEVRGYTDNIAPTVAMHAVGESVTDSKTEQPEKLETHATQHITQAKEAANEDHEERKDREVGRDELNGNANVVAAQNEDIDMPDIDNQAQSGVTISNDRNETGNASAIIEKGIVSFFLPCNDEANKPEAMEEVEKLYMVLQALPDGEKLVDGKRARLIVIPKTKPLAKIKGYERFLSSIAITNTKSQELEIPREKTCETKQSGLRSNSPVQRIGKGVYALSNSSDERQSLFSYVFCIPEKSNELLMDLGLPEKGSFVVFGKNSQTSRPADMNGGMVEAAECHEGNVLMLISGSVNGNDLSGNGILNSCEDTRLEPLNPGNLGGKNTENLYVQDKQFEQGENKEEPGNLNHGDEESLKHFNGIDSVFADLELRKKELLSMETTWA